MRKLILLTVIPALLCLFASCAERDHSNPFDIITTSRPEAMSSISATGNLGDITSSSARMSWTRNTDDDFFAYRVLVGTDDTVMEEIVGGEVETIEELYDNISDEFYDYFAYYEVFFNSGIDSVEVRDLDAFTYYYAAVLTENKAGYISASNILEFRTQPDTAYSFEMIDPLSTLDMTEVQTMVSLDVMNSDGTPEQILVAGYLGSPSLYGGQGDYALQNMLKMAWPFTHETYGFLTEFDNLALQRIACPGIPEKTEITFPNAGLFPDTAPATAGYFLIFDGEDPYCFIFMNGDAEAPDLSELDEDIFFHPIDISGMSSASEIAAEFASFANDQWQWYAYVDETDDTVVHVHNVNPEMTLDAGDIDIYETGSGGEEEFGTPFAAGSFSVTQDNPGLFEAQAEVQDYHDTYRAVQDDSPWDLSYAENPFYSAWGVLEYAVDDIFSIATDDDKSYLYFTDAYMGTVMGFEADTGTLLDTYEASAPAELEDPFDNFYIPYVGFEDESTVEEGDPIYSKYGDIVSISMSTPEGDFLPFSAFKVINYYDEGDSSFESTLFGATKEGSIYRFDQTDNSDTELAVPEFNADSTDLILNLFTFYEDEYSKDETFMTGWPDWDEIAAFDYYYDVDTDGAVVFVLERKNSRILTVGVESDGTTSLYEIYGGPGTDFGEFNGPQDMLIYEENIFVADTLNHRVQILKFTDEGIKFISSIGSYGYAESQFVNPKKLDVFSYDREGGESPVLYMMVTDDKKTRYFPIGELFPEEE